MLDEIIKKFCGDDDLRPNMMLPIIDGDNIVATNAHVIISAPKSYFNKLYAENGLFPDYKKVIPDHFKGALLAVIDTIKIAEIIKPIANIPVYEDCDNCKGKGDIYCNACRHSHECESCDGTGYSRTILRYEFPTHQHSIQIKDVLIATKYMGLISEVADIIGAPLQLVLLQKSGPCIFYVKDIMLLVSPLISAYVNNVILID